MTDGPVQARQSSNGPSSGTKRIFAFLRGHQAQAEDFPTTEDIPTEPWIERSSGDPERSTYAVEVAKRWADAMEATVMSLQDKASSLTTLVVALIPVGITFAGLALGDFSRSPIAASVALALFLAAVCLLLVAAIRGFLCSGATLAGAVNARRLSPAARSLSALKVREADAWVFSAEVALRVMQRRNLDLFAARRAVVCAFLVAALATPFFVIAHTATNQHANTLTITVDLSA